MMMAPQEQSDELVEEGRTQSGARLASHVEMVSPMQRAQRKREGHIHRRCGQAVISAGIQFTDEVRVSEPTP